MRRKSRKKARVSRFARNRKGFTLIETMVAVMLISIVVISVFSIALTSRVASRNTSRRAEALYYTRQAMEKLKAYVAVNPADVQGIDPLINKAGPNGRWAIPEDTCQNCGTGAGQCWALQRCRHDLTALLPAKLRGPDVNMTLTYTVTDTDCNPADPIKYGKCPRVDFHVKWAQKD